MFTAGIQSIFGPYLKIHIIFRPFFEIRVVQVAIRKDLQMNHLKDEESE
jgi:hypothetical protein